MSVPYLAWGLYLLLSYLYSLSEKINLSNAVLDFIGGVATVYAIGILLWGIPYTLLVLGLLIWSIRKSASSMYKVFLLSPVLLAVLMTIEVSLVSIPINEFSAPIDGGFLAYAAVGVIPALAFGYFFVGVGAIVYQLVRRMGLLHVEAAPIPAQAA